MAELATEQKAKRAAYMREWRRRNPERAREIERASYWRNRDKKNAQKRLYHAAHREESKKRNQRWAEENRERSREIKTAWKDRNPNAGREYYQRNRERIRARSAAYYQENREQFMAWSRNRKARLRDAVGRHTAADVRARFSMHGNRCIYCGATENLTVDHLIPLIRGGTNWPANLAPACLSCNCGKKAKTYFEFMDRR